MMIMSCIGLDLMNKVFVCHSDESTKPDMLQVCLDHKLHAWDDRTCM